MISKLFCIECAKSCARDNDCFVCEICSRFFHKDCLALPNDLSLKSNPSFIPTYTRCLNCKSRVANNANSEQNFSRTVTTDAELSYSDFFDNCDYYDQQALSELLCTQKESLFIMHFNVRSLP